MSYSIIILNYNNSKDTIDLVQRIIKFRGLDHVVIVDNSSSKDQYQRLNEFVLAINEAKIVLFESGSNFGYAKGNNIGLNILRKMGYEGTVIVMNPDVIISEKSIDRVVSFSQELPPSILSPKILGGKSWWEFTNYRDTVLKTFLHLKTKFEAGNNLKNTNSLQQVDVLSGAFLAAKMSTWKLVDGFDENTFLYFEEEILQYKALSMGVKSFLVLDSEYQHKGGTSTNTDGNKNSLKSIISHEWRIQKSREYYFSRYLHVDKIKLLLLRLLFFVYTPLVIIKRKLK